MKKIAMGMMIAGLLVGWALSASAAPQSGNSVQFTVKNNGKAEKDVVLVLDVSNVGKGQEQIGVTDSQGTAVSPMDISIVGKFEADVWVQEGCPDGKTHLVFTSAGQVPQGECKKQWRIGAIPWGSASRVTIDIGKGTVSASSPSNTAVGSSSAPNFDIWLQGGGDFGLANFRDTGSFCSSFLKSNPGGKCSTGNKVFKVRTDGSLNIGKGGWGGGIAIGYEWRRDVNSNASSQSGAQSFFQNNSLKVNSFFVEARLFVPVVKNHLILVPAIGRDFWTATSKQTVGSSSGGTGSSNSSVFDETGSSARYGGGLQFPIGKYVSLNTDFRYEHIRKQSSINQNEWEFMGGIRFNLNLFKH